MKKSKRMIIIILFCLSILCVFNFSQKALENTEDDEKSLYRIEHKICNIQGITDTYRILFVNDLHIIEPNDEVAADKMEEVKSRQLSFSNTEGVLSSEYWLQLAPELAKEEADAIVFNGDILDYLSEANYELFLSGLNQIETPYMFLKADHDVGTWYGNYSESKLENITKEISNIEPVEVIENDEIIIVGINLSTSQLTQEGLEALKDVFAIGKPIILVTHVPINSNVDTTLYESSLEVWGQRALIWGNGCYYEPNAITSEYINMVYGPDSPVVAVIGAHLHFSNDIMLNDNIPQHVFDATYKGTIGELIITK